MALLKALRLIVGAITVITGIKNFRTVQKLKDQGQDILATKTAQGGKIPIIYGRRRVGSTLLYMDTDSGNSKELFVIYGLCLGEVDSIELDTIEINGVPLSDTKVFRDGYYTGSDKISSGAGSLNTASQIGTSSGSFRGDGRSGTDPTKIYRMVLNAHHGADDQTVDPMLNASQSTKFTSNHRLRGIAYIAASFQYDEKGMFTSVPELTVVVKGKKLYDPRLDGSITGGTGSHRIDDPTTYEWSNNAALTLLDYMHQDYGKGLATSSIDLQSFQTAANTADTIVDVPDYSGSYASATFSADVEDNFITVNEATWKKIKGGELLSVKDSSGSVIINQNNVIDSQRFTPHTESTNFRIYIDGVPPAKVSKSVTFSATNGDATITVSCTSHGASANDRVLFSGATSLGGNITATVLNKGYTIATVIDANSFTIEATDLNLTTVLANSSDTGNGGGGAVGKFMYADESGLFLAQTRRLQCDGVLDTNETVLDNARDLLSNMRGFLNYIDGKYSVLVEDATSSSFSITDDHIIDQGIKIRYEDKAEKLNKVVVKFFNAQKKYETDTKTVFHNNSTSTYKNDDGGEELETTAEFQYITNPYNAFNMGKGILERSRRQKTISFIGTPRLLNLTAGDVVTITYTPYNLSNAAYRIETINLLDNGLVGIQAIEYFDLYTWSATPPEENVGGEPDLPTGTEAEPPTNLTFTDATSTRRAFLTWTAATNYPAKEFRVVIKNSSGQEIHNRIVSDAFIDLDFIAVANGYVASITSISSTGAESSATSITFNVTQQPVKLGDIQANAITANEINVTDLSAISADLGSITAGSINIGSGAFTVSSSGVLEATGATISGAITASSLNVTGATVTGTIDASKITLNGDPLTDIFALASDTEGENILFKESGTTFGALINGASNFVIKSMVNNKDIILKGIDGGVPRNALTLDMSLQGAATFHSTSPAEFKGALTVGGAITVFQNVLTSTNALKLNSGQSSITLFNTNTFDVLYRSGNHIFEDASGSNERFRISGTGLIGLGGANYGTSGQVITSNGSSTPPTWQTISNAVTSYTNGVDNRLVTSTGTAGINGEANLTFDGSTLNVTGNIIVSNDLTVQGTTTTIDTTNLEVKDKNITLNYSTGDSSANADGAGITIQDAVNSSTDATILWDATNDEFDFSHGITLPDDKALKLGAGNDLVIDHNTANTVSRIIDNSGILNIQQSGDDGVIRFQSDNGSGGVTTYYSVNGQLEVNQFFKDIKLGDSVKANFGTSNDLQIFHNGTKSVIQNAVGHLEINNNADDSDILFKSDNGSGGLTTYFMLDGGLGLSRAIKNIRFDDSVKATFGSSNDLQIFHTGSSSVIADAGTGDLKIRANDLIIQSYSLEHNYIQADEGGEVRLYHNNSEKLNTTSSGATVTGTLTATTLAGTLSTASQPNITSVGTLTSLSSGAITSTGQVKAQSLFIDSGGYTPTDVEGRHFKYYLVSQSTDTNFKKVADVTVGTGNFKALALRVILESQSGNFGNTVAVDKTEYVCNFYRSAGSQDSEDTATISGQDPTFHNLRIVKTATGVYELQVKQNANFKDAILHIEILSTNGGSITITDGNVNGSTSGTITTPNSIESQSTYSFNKVDTPFLNIQSSIKVNSTQILDSARNLSNIGTISSGAITATGSTADNSSDSIVAKNSSNSTLLRARSDGVVFIPTNYLFVNSSQGIYSTGSIKARGGITNDLGNNLSINSGGSDIQFNSKNFTSVGTISSGDIEISDTLPLLTLKKSDETGRQSKIQQASGITKISSRNNASNGQIVFEGFTASSTTEYARFDSSGNLGVGLTPSFSASGRPSVEIGGSTQGNLAFNGSGNTGLIITNSAHNGSAFVAVNTGVSSAYSQESGGHRFFSAPSVSAGASQTFTERFKIASDGKTTFNSNITIPATVPSSKGGKALRFPVDADVSGTTELEFFTPLSSPASTLTVNNTLTAGKINIPSDGTNDTRIEIGTNTLANHNAFIDLRTDTTYTDYGLRLIRSNGGANTNSKLVHRGTGGLFIEAQDAGSVILKTNGSDALKVDSSQRVGIGTTSPSSVLHVVGGSATIPTLSNSHPFTISNNGNSGMSIISSGTTNAGQVVFGDADDADIGRLRYDHSDNSMRFFTNVLERMRIDSSGNLLVSKTSSDLTTDGIELRDTGGIVAIRTNGDPLYLNRKSTDGAISTFAKDGTTIGTIGSEGGDSLFIQGGSSSGSGLLMHGTGAKVLPLQNGASVDATIDLGQSSRRFKDLHLSGTINSGVITSTGASSGRYTGLEVVNSTNAGGTETAIGLGVVSASNAACDVKLVANRVGANSGSDFYIEQTDSSGSQQETFRITESGNATFAGEIFLGNNKEINFAKADGTNDGTKIERFGGNALRFRYAGNAAIFDDLDNNGFQVRNSGDTEVFRVIPNSSVGSSTTDIVNGALRMGSTTIIDVSRNLTNIGTYSGVGNSTFRGSGANSTNAFKVERASDNAIALRIQNSGEVVVENNYLYASHTGTAFYVQGGAVFRGGISNDTSGQPVTFTDDINVQGVIQKSGTTIVDASRNILNLASLSMHDNILRLRNNGDSNHYLQYKATGHSGVAIDGAQLQGHQGGELTTNLGGNNYSLRWNNSGDIIVRNTVNAVKGVFTQTGGDFPLLTSTVYDYVAKFESTDVAAFIILEDSASTNNGNRIGVSGDTMEFFTAASKVLSLSNANDATFTGNVTAFSDKRLKDKIQTLDGKKALQMRGVSYIRDGKEGSGVIAQEIEKIAPELVLTADDEQGTKSVAYGNLVGYLIEAIKDQQEQIDELKARLDECA